MKRYLKYILIVVGIGVIVAFTTNTQKEEKMNKGEEGKPKLIYVFDPLCGWCYGFEPVMVEIQEKYNDKYSFEVIPGGMVPKHAAQPISNMRAFLLGAIPQLEKRTGIKIAQPYYDSILNKDGVVLNSELPSQAFIAALPYYEGKEVVLAKKIQDLLYQEGLDISKVSSFENIEGLDTAVLNTPELEEKMKLAFSKSQKLGVRGFPAVLVETNNQYYQIASGYVDYQNMSKILDKVLKESNK